MLGEHNHSHQVGYLFKGMLGLIQSCQQGQECGTDQGQGLDCFYFPPNTAARA